MTIGVPNQFKLHLFGGIVRDGFGDTAYLVGSALTSKIWRDVDVRVLLDDPIYESCGFGNPQQPHTNAKWVAVCLAWSALGKDMTGLPIDFQVQQRSYANRVFHGQSRSALIEIWRMEAENARS